MYGADGNDEKCGEINFGLDYDFATQTLKLKIIQANSKIEYLIKCFDQNILKHKTSNILTCDIIEISGKRLGS